MTDHAQEAEKLLEPLRALTAKDAAFDLELAQVHATLALVEQQRIANLIALGQFRVGVTDLPHMRDLAIRPTGPDSIGPTEEIAAALGITEES